jgi:4-hydroxy-tetrahydrodipicolinate synthase
MLEVKGVVPPLITPLDENEKLDEGGLRRLINYVMKGGVHGIFVIGSTGEFYGLSFEDKKKIVEIAMEEVNGRIPVYVGASAITTRDCIRLAEMAKSYEAAAITVLTPMFITPNEKELYDHFAAIAKAVDIPNVIYNNPERTGVNMSAGLVEQLADIDNIVAAKDTSGDMTLTSEYIRRTKDKS